MVGQKGRSGRPGKPTAQHKAEGTERSYRHANRADARIEPSVLPCPGDLGTHGAEMWKRICKTLPKEIVTKLDTDSLRVYCETWEVYRKVYPLMLDDPTDKNTNVLWAKIVDKLDKLGRQFGWSPQSRTSLQMPEVDQEVDPMVEFLKRRERN